MFIQMHWNRIAHAHNKSFLNAQQAGIDTEHAHSSPVIASKSMQ